MSLAVSAAALKHFCHFCTVFQGNESFEHYKALWSTNVEKFPASHTFAVMIKNSNQTGTIWFTISRVSESLFWLRWPDATWLPSSLLTPLFMSIHPPNWLFDRLGPFMSIHPSGWESALINSRDGGNSALKSAESIIVISWGTVSPACAWLHVLMLHFFDVWATI